LKLHIFWQEIQIPIENIFAAMDSKNLKDDYGRKSRIFEKKNSKIPRNFEKSNKIRKFQ
jgi:hypothetical protein